MDTHGILKELHEERERIDKAIALLETLGGGAFPSKAAIRSTKKAKAAKPKAGKKVRRRKPMSAATKKHLSELAKQRWAKRKAKTA
ncbi:MAG: hypothetical protein ACP5EP_06015 [Acidobacteriaceae bacterium]